MVIASMAWTFKTWFALTLPKLGARREVLSMEFKKFLDTLMCIPCHVVKGARHIRLRLLGITEHVQLLFASLKASKRLSFG